MTATTAARPGIARSLVQLGPHRGAHRVALRAGIAVAIPLAVLLATGHLDLALYAVFGAFTALYGRTHTHGTRLRMQAIVAVALVGAVVLGTAISLSPAADWLVLPIAALVAGGATFLSDALDWHPPGALFFVFALAACASVPPTTGQPGAERLLIALLLASASAAVGMLVSTIGIVRPRARQLTPTRFAVSFRAAAARRGEVTKVVTVTLAVLVAGAIPTATGLGHPYWAMVSAVAALSAADAAGRVVRAGHRVLGTLLGVALAAGLLAIGTAPALLILFVVLLQMGAELFVGRNYGITMIFVTPLALIMTQLAHPHDELALLRDRALETVLGAAVGLGVSLLITLIARRAAHSARPAGPARPADTARPTDPAHPAD